MLARWCAMTLLLTLVTSCGDGDSTDADQAASPTPSASATDAPSPSASDEPSPSPSPSPSSSSEKRGTRIVTSQSPFGPVLFDSTGQAIYLFDVETSPKPRCYDDCAQAWPPVLTSGEPVAGRGVDPSQLSTTRRRDGTVQVTYHGHPLYFYAHEGTGEVTCHDVFLNGGTWYVVQPGGDPAPPG